MKNGTSLSLLLGLLPACAVAPRGGADCDIDLANMSDRSVIQVSHESIPEKGLLRMFVAPAARRATDLRSVVPVLVQERDDEFLVYASGFSRESLVTAPYELVLKFTPGSPTISVEVLSPLSSNNAPIATGSLPVITDSAPWFTTFWEPKEWDPQRNKRDDPRHEIRVWLGTTEKVDFALLESSK